MRCRAWLGVHFVYGWIPGKAGVVPMSRLVRVVQVVVTERIVGNARAIHRIGYGGA